VGLGRRDAGAALHHRISHSIAPVVAVTRTVDDDDDVEAVRLAYLGLFRFVFIYFLSQNTIHSTIRALVIAEHPRCLVCRSHEAASSAPRACHPRVRVGGLSVCLGLGSSRNRQVAVQGSNPAIRGNRAAPSRPPCSGIPDSPTGREPGHIPWPRIASPLSPTVLPPPSIPQRPAPTPNSQLLLLMTTPAQRQRASPAPHPPLFPSPLPRVPSPPARRGSLRGCDCEPHRPALHTASCRRALRYIIKPARARASG
jgi:hypothetical protein